jgi:hypothetical protein
MFGGRDARLFFVTLFAALRASLGCPRFGGHHFGREPRGAALPHAPRAPRQDWLSLNDARSPGAFDSALFAPDQHSCLVWLNPDLESEDR